MLLFEFGILFFEREVFPRRKRAHFLVVSRILSTKNCREELWGSRLVSKLELCVFGCVGPPWSLLKVTVKLHTKCTHRLVTTSHIAWLILLIIINIKLLEENYYFNFLQLIQLVHAKL